MSCLQVILAIIFPPLAVIDRGCGSMLIVFLLSLVGWVPGVIARVDYSQQEQMTIKRYMHCCQA